MLETSYRDKRISLLGESVSTKRFCTYESNQDVLKLFYIYLSPNKP